MTTLAAPQIGSTAAELLFRVTQLGLIAKAPRVRTWERTLAQAFQAYATGQPDRPCDLPSGATSANGETSDSALSILNAFDTWVGNDLVWKCYEIASSGTVCYE
jgi:hypothetical protein